MPTIKEATTLHDQIKQAHDPALLDIALAQHLTSSLLSSFGTSTGTPLNRYANLIDGLLDDHAGGLGYTPDQYMAAKSALQRAGSTLGYIATYETPKTAPAPDFPPPLTLLDHAKVQALLCFTKLACWPCLLAISVRFIGITNAVDLTMFMHV